MPAPLYRTLGELRRVVLARLGFGGQGASGGANQVLIDSFLQEAQITLYHLQDWNNLQGFDEVEVGTEQNLVDFPESCSRHRRILKLELFNGGYWGQMREGIPTSAYSTMDTLSYPSRYEKLEQIQLWPKANGVYKLRIWRVRDLSPFIADNDRCSIDDSMVLLHATTFAKAHYRQPDAASYQGQLDTLLASIRGYSFGSNSVYRRSRSASPLQNGCDGFGGTVVIGPPQSGDVPDGFFTDTNGEYIVTAP